MGPQRVSDSQSPVPQPFLVPLPLSLSFVASLGFEPHPHSSPHSPIPFLPYRTSEEIRIGYTCSIHRLKDSYSPLPVFSPCSLPPPFLGSFCPTSFLSFSLSELPPAPWRPCLLIPLTPQSLSTSFEFDRDQKWCFGSGDGWVWSASYRNAI